MLQVHIGESEHEFVDLKILGRSHPLAADYSDGNWLMAGVEVAAGGFRGTVQGDLRSEEFEPFFEQLNTLYKGLSGQASFVTLEGWLTLRITGDRHGHLTVRCEIMDRAGTGNKLECEFGIDQSYVPPILQELRQVLDTFPVVGR